MILSEILLRERENFMYRSFSDGKITYRLDESNIINHQYKTHQQYEVCARLHTCPELLSKYLPVNFM